MRRLYKKNSCRNSCDGQGANEENKVTDEIVNEEGTEGHISMKVEQTDGVDINAPTGNAAGNDAVDASRGNGPLSIRTVLVVCPINVIENWSKEFAKWVGYSSEHPIYLLKVKQLKL